MKIQETWRVISGYPRYHVSSEGRIKSFTSSRYPEGKILKIHYNKDGYGHVNLCEGYERDGENRKKTLPVHRLVALNFIPIPDELKEYDISQLHVDHIDTNTANSKVGNLRWCTPMGNVHNPITLEKLRKLCEKKRKTVYQYDEDLTLINTFESTAEAARRLNASQGNIAQCVNGYLPRYLGYIFSYEPLTDIKQREEKEKEAEPMRLRTKRNVMNAVSRWQKKATEEGYSWYARHRERGQALSKKYYWSHREEILRKSKEKREQERKNRGTA